MYFNNKSLIVYVNHVLLGFYLCQSRIHIHDGFNNVELQIAYTIESINFFLKYDAIIYSSDSSSDSLNFKF